MKQKEMAAVFCLVGALALTGCGNADGSGPIQIMDTASEKSEDGQEDAGQDQEDENVATNQEGQQEGMDENSDSSGDDASDTVSEEPADREEDKELTGIVVSVGEDSVVLSETVTEYMDENIWAASEGDQITVYFSNVVSYEYKTVRNSGVNGEADVERREGNFADIGEGTTLELTGSWQGEAFYAEEAVITVYL